MHIAMRCTAGEVVRLADEGTFSSRVSRETASVFGRVSPAELNSISVSVPILARLLLDAGLASVTMLIEVGLPTSGRSRMDVVLVGVGKDGQDVVLPVELKQWSSYGAFSDNGALVHIPAYNDSVLNPAVQLDGYMDHLVAFLPQLQDITGVAFLHNLVESRARELSARAETTNAVHVFGSNYSDVKRFFAERLMPTGSDDAADRFTNQRPQPSRRLMESISTGLNGIETFSLVGNQRLSYELVLQAVEDALHQDTKTPIIVVGPAGSGKSVIALAILREMANRQKTALHATGSKAMTLTLRKQVGDSKRAALSKVAFRYFNQFIASDPNWLDVGLFDEAQRIRDVSIYRFTTKSDREVWEKRGRPSQVHELLSLARVPVFFLDEDQAVRDGEIGTVLEIEYACRKRKTPLQPKIIRLEEQFRCGGSPVFDDWLRAALGIGGRSPYPWPGNDHFDLRLADDAAGMKTYLAGRLVEGNEARIAAGYCWPWSDPQEGQLVNDIRIGELAAPWNSREDIATLESPDGPVPPGPLWATSEGGFGQIGCIYTAQGHEYPHAGVIMGPDLVRRGDRWVVNLDASYDLQVKRASNADRLIPNAYRVLATRGLQSCVLTSTDPETLSFFRTLGVPGLND